MSGGEFWISRAVLENSGVCLTSFRTWEEDRSDMMLLQYRSQNRSISRGRDSEYRNARKMKRETSAKTNKSRRKSETGEEREFVCLCRYVLLTKT